MDFEYIADLDINEILDLLIEAADSVRISQAEKEYFAAYPGICRRHEASIKSNTELCEALRSEVKRRGEG